MFFFAVSVVVVSAPKLGTGTESGGRGTLVLCPRVLETTAALATRAVFSVVIPNGVGEELRKNKTTAAVVLISVAMMDRLSIVAPSPPPSTSRVQPPPRIPEKFVELERAGVAPRVANFCRGRSTSRGCLLVDELLTVSYKLLATSY